MTTAEMKDDILRRELILEETSKKSLRDAIIQASEVAEKRKKTPQIINASVIFEYPDKLTLVFPPTSYTGPSLYNPTALEDETYVVLADCTYTYIKENRTVEIVKL